MTFINKYFNTLVVIAFFVFFMFSDTFSGCRKQFGNGNLVPDTISDVTVNRPQPVQYVPVYIPAQSGSTIYREIPVQAQPSQDIEALKQQYATLAKEFYAVKNYKDSIELKDTAGKKVGIVNLNDEVTENSITSRKPSYQLAFPERIITLQEPYKPRTQVYIGAEADIAKTGPTGASAGLMLKNKKDKIYKVTLGGQKIGENIQPYGSVGYYIKIGKR